MSPPVIITTIQPITAQMSVLADEYTDELVVVADRKTPRYDEHDSLTFLSVEDQEAMPYELARSLPFNHYSRKNLGFLYVIQSGHGRFVETDDDNRPSGGWGTIPGEAYRLEASSRFINVYRHFSSEHSWPRGFPLERIKDPATVPRHAEMITPSPVAVWQGLVNGEPDVDAIYRLTVPGSDGLNFDEAEAVVLPAGSYCPFNSQNTLWEREAMDLAYLPTSVRFRYTDILRSYVAQRILHERDLRLGFMGPTAVQDRNPHDLLSDFADEVDCYLDVASVVDCLEGLSLPDDPNEQLSAAYAGLASEGFVDGSELELVGMWQRDVRAARDRGSR